ncbi:hypothetical protein Gpo141_00000221 [Globisporangium polare]
MAALCLSSSVKRQYFSATLSAAHVVSWSLFLLALVLPLLLAHDFWRRVSSYREQPKVALTYQVLAILEGVTEDPDTHTQEHLTIVQTTLPSRIQHLLQENTRASQFKSYEIDEDRDGLADSLHVDIATPLASTERIHQVTVVAILNYTLEGRVKLSMDAVAMHSQTSPLAGESLHVDGNLVLEQREPIHSKKSMQYPYAASPLFNMSKIQSVQDISIQKLVSQYRQRDCSVYFQSPLPVWTNDVGRFTIAIRPRQFRTSMVIRVPAADVLYYPSWSEVLKNAWIQYYCILVILSTLTSFLCDFLFKNKVLDTFCLIDGQRSSAKKQV